MKCEPDQSKKQAHNEVAIVLRRRRDIDDRLHALKAGDSAFRPAGGSSSLREVTEKLRMSEERFHSLCNSSAICIAISTPQSRFLLANGAYCRMLGYTESELQGLDFAALTHPDDLAANLDLRNEVPAGRRYSFVLEKGYLKKGGNIQWIRPAHRPCMRPMEGFQRS